MFQKRLKGSEDIKGCMQKRDWLKATGKFNDYKIMRNSIVEKN